MGVYENEPKTKKEALKQSIEHWERMILCAEKFAKIGPETGSPDRWDMVNAIGEAWFSEDCGLCTYYIIVCSKCPLGKITQCEDHKSAWWFVNNASTWEDWLKAARVMLKTLKSLR